MPQQPSTDQSLRAENAELRARLEEAEEKLRAIRAGEVDALVVEGDAGPRLFTLQGLDAGQIRARGEMLAQVSNAVLAVDLEERITFLNAAAERQYRVRAGDVLGRKLGQIYTRHWPSPEREAAAWAALREHGEWRGEYLQRTHDGRELHVDSTLTALRDADGQTIGHVTAVRDITERKRAEEALRASEERFRAFVTASSDVIYRMNADWSEMRQLDGREFLMDTKAPRHNWLQEYIYEQDQPHVMTVIKEAIRTKSIFTLEHPVRRADGTVGWTFSRAVPLLDAQGEIREWFGAASDITEHKRGEEALRQNAALFSSLIAQAPMGTYVVDAEFRMRQVNAEAMPAFMSVQPVIGRGFQEVVEILWGPEVGGQIAGIFRHTLATGERYVSPSFTEQRHDLGIAQSYEWETQRVRLPDGQHGVVCYFHEVTERARATEALRASEQRMRLATEATQVGIWEWNVLTNQIRWDAQMFRIYGIAPTADGFVDYTDWSGAVLPEDLVENEVILKDTLRQCGKSERTFHIRRRDDGECRLVTAVETVRVNAQGQAEWVVGTSLDITERKQKEEALHASEERFRVLAGQLEHLVKERTEELVQSQDRLRALATELNLAEHRERKRLADELHDYLAQLLVLGCLKLGQVRRAGLPSKAEETVKETEEVLTQALNYSRTLMAELSPRILQEHGLPAGLTWLGEQMQRQGLRVRVTIGDMSSVSLTNDCETLLFQSVRELLMNALKHADSTQVVVQLQQSESRLCIEVRDDGVGFDLAAAAAAGSSTTAMSSKFGLFSIRERMAALGGWFDVQSAPGEGAMATLVLPIGDGAVAGSELKVLSSKLGRPEPGVLSNQARNSEPRTQNSKLHQQEAKIRVLLVDDHAMVRQGLRSVLDSYADIEVVGEAWDGEEAVAGTDRFHPAIVVMDINMPKMNGIEATEHIKARYPEVIVIGMSVQAGGANEEAMKKAGASMLLTKEAVVEELYRAIRQTLDLKHKGKVLSPAGE